MRTTASLWIIAALTFLGACTPSGVESGSTAGVFYQYLEGTLESPHAFVVRGRRSATDPDRPIGLQEGWYCETGLLIHRGVWESDGAARATAWNPDGSIADQTEWFGGEDAGGWQKTEEPPWQWGVTRQDEPTAPWIEAGLAFDAWWASIPDEKRIQ